MTDNNSEDIPISKAIIRQIIKDLGMDNRAFYWASKYIESERFSVLLVNSKYPPELLDSLKELVLLSKAQRKISSRQILAELSENHK